MLTLQLEVLKDLTDIHVDRSQAYAYGHADSKEGMRGSLDVERAELRRLDLRVVPRKHE